MMPTNLPAIADIIERALSWEIQDDSAFKVIVSANTTELLMVPAAHVELAHPHYVAALRAQIRWREQELGQSLISGVLASATLNVLANNYVNLKYRHGVEKLFSDIDEVLISATTVHLVGTWVSTMTAENNGDTIKFATGRYTFKHAVPPDLLEENFPGWESRWAIANELGLDSDVRMRYVFTTPTPTNCIGLPDISLS